MVNSRSWAVICRFDTWIVVDRADKPLGFKFSANHTPTLGASGGNMKLSVSKVGVLFSLLQIVCVCTAGMPAACNYDPLIRVGNSPQGKKGRCRTRAAKKSSVMWQI